MDIGVISVRYARALLKSAEAIEMAERVYKEMQSLSTSYLQVPQLRATIDNPMLSKTKKQELLETACGQETHVEGTVAKGISDLTRQFIQLVLDESREDILQLMATAYITLYRKQNHIIRGKLTTATAVSTDTEAKMKQMVERRTLGTVEFQTEVNPDIIGGFILEYDTYRMDASVKTKLNTILTGLTK